MHSVLNKKIPSLLGLFIIGFGVFTTTALVRGDQLYQTYAVPGDEPENIQLSNITDTSFTITYTTDKPTLGSIRFGQNPAALDQNYLEDRNKYSQELNNYKTHSISVDSLNPDSTYYFEIISGDVTKSNNGYPFNVKTALSISSNSSSNGQISGNAVNPDGSIPAGAVVIVEINGAQKISSLLDENGKFNISLNNLRTEDLTNYFEVNDNSLANITVNSSDFSSLVSVSGNNLSLIPTITLSKDYDFSSSIDTPKPQANSSNIKYPEFDSSPRTRTNTTISPTKTPTSSAVR